VLKEACREAARWPGALTVTINVSPVQVMAGDLVERAIDAARAAGMRPERVEIEITESALLNDGQAAAQSIHDLHAEGFRLALDDFGTGYSALAYLRRYPFNTLKIDGSFVRELLARADARAIVKMIVGLGRTLKLQTVAEGVEDPIQAGVLFRYGCASMQGYLVSRPLEAADVPAFLRHWAARTPSRWPEAAVSQPVVVT
jgi:EAL domain-containing protein (putative c-di-GMP-specific phosphodiesterase class I)